MNIPEFLDYPTFFNTHRNAKTLFDPVRRKSVAATPEEFVRQFMLLYLMREKNFPRTLLGVEVALTINKLPKRCDIVAYKETKPVLLVECKAPSVKISQSVFNQVARYNLALRVPYLLVTNGYLSLCSKVNLKEGTFQFLDGVPDFSVL